MSKIPSFVATIAFVGLFSNVFGCTVAADEPEFEAEQEGPTGVASAAIVGDSGKLNLWDDRDYTDTHISRYSYDSDLGNDGFNDKASSLVNKTDAYWQLFTDKNYGGTSICIRPYSHVANLGACSGFFCMAWNDRISSVKKLTSSAPCNGIVGDPN